MCHWQRIQILNPNAASHGLEQYGCTVKHCAYKGVLWTLGKSLVFSGVSTMDLISKVVKIPHKANLTKNEPFYVVPDLAYLITVIYVRF